MKLWVISSVFGCVHLGVGRVLRTLLIFLSTFFLLSTFLIMLQWAWWALARKGPLGSMNSGGGLGRLWHVGWPKLSTLCLRNNNLSRFSALRRYLYLPANLATLNSLSDAQLDEGIARYFRARLANFGNSFSWLCHHCTEDQIPDPSKEVSRISQVRPPLLLVIVFLLQEMLHSMDSVLPPPVLSSPLGLIWGTRSFFLL